MAVDRIKFTGVNCCYMMAIVARHRLASNLNSLAPDICFIYGEDGDSWVGRWILNYTNIYDVLFPKTSTRQLTPYEIDKYKDITEGEKGKSLFSKHQRDAVENR